MESTKGILDLPPELVLMIIKELDSDRDLRNVSLVNHYLREAAVDELFKKVDLRCEGDSIQNFYFDILHFSNLSHTSPEERSKSCEQVKRFVPGRKVQELALSVSQKAADRKKIDDIVECFPGVTTILFEAYGSNFSSVRVKTILTAAVSSMNRLNTIKWNWRSKLYSLPLDRISRFPTLTNLVLDFAHFQHTDPSDVGLPPKLTGGMFTSLKVDNFPFRFREAKWLLDWTKRLEHLDITFVELRTGRTAPAYYDEIIDALASHRKTLQVLKIGVRCGHNITWGTRNLHLSDFTALHEVNLAMPHRAWEFAGGWDIYEDLLSCLSLQTVRFGVFEIHDMCGRDLAHTINGAVQKGAKLQTFHLIAFYCPRLSLDRDWLQLAIDVFDSTVETMQMPITVKTELRDANNSLISW